jgi:hypothetical protein
LNVGVDSKNIKHLEQFLSNKDRLGELKSGRLSSLLPSRVSVDDLRIKVEHEKLPMTASLAMSWDVVANEMNVSVRKATIRDIDLIKNQQYLVTLEDKDETLALAAANQTIDGNEIKGKVTKDLSKLSLFFKNMDPQILSHLGIDFIQTDDLNSAVAMMVKRVGGGKYRVNVHAGSSNLVLDHEMFSTSTIGPIPFILKIGAQFDSNARTLDVTNGELTFKRKSMREVTATFAGRVDLGKRDQMPAALTFSLPRTPCQNVLNVAPANLFPRLQTFKLGGDLGMTITVTADLKDPGSLDYQWLSRTFDCSVLSSDYEFSQSRLLSEVPIHFHADGTLNLDPLTANIEQYEPISRFSPYIQIAFTAAEDSAFWSHNGIDFGALDQALRRNLQEKGIVIGGSTITMQTAKNLFLNHDRTLSRKLQELFLTWHLEQILPKTKIFEIYANIIEFGPGIIGIKDAARHFFNKSPSELTLLESAYLASVLPSPTNRYRNFCKGSISENYRNLVMGIIERAASRSQISPSEFVSAKTATLQFSKAPEARKLCTSHIASNELYDEIISH